MNSCFIIDPRTQPKQMQSDNWPRSKKCLSRKFSDQTIAYSWSAVQCLGILLWRGMHKVEDQVDNFFRFRFCLTVWLLNIIFCFILSSVRRDGEKYQMSMVLLKFGLVTPMLIHILSILFGAPFLKYWDQTISFSMLGCALILPSVATSGKLGNFSSFSGSLDWIGANELWTCLGAWLGAFVIPLDWDRPWQVWPEPCCFGAVLGCGLSSLLKLIRTTPLGAAGYQMYWPTQFFVHERHV